MINRSLFSEEVTQSEDGLFFGDNKVKCSTAVLGSEEIPALYTIRVFKAEDEQYSNFVCSLDLTPCGKIWLGGVMLTDYGVKSQSFPACYFTSWKTVKHILDTIAHETKGKKWYICEEEDFDAVANAWEEVQA